jgi:hypothetical protein
MQVLLSEITIPERRQRHEVGDIDELLTLYKRLVLFILLSSIVITLWSLVFVGILPASFWAGLALIVTTLTSLIPLFFI